MSNNNSQLLYALECGHGAPGAPTLVSGALYCAWHGDHRNIVAVIEYEWKAKCLSCKFGRWAGLSKQNATIFAQGHSRREPAHKVIIEYVKNPNATANAEKMRKWKAQEAR